MFPDAYEVVVDLDPEKQGQKIENVRIVSFEDFKRGEESFRYWQSTMIFIVFGQFIL